MTKHEHTHTGAGANLLLNINLTAWCEEYGVDEREAHEQIRRDVRDAIEATFTTGKWADLVCSLARNDGSGEW